MWIFVYKIANKMCWYMAFIYLYKIRIHRTLFYLLCFINNRLRINESHEWSYAHEYPMLCTWLIWTSSFPIRIRKDFEFSLDRRKLFQCNVETPSKIWFNFDFSKKIQKIVFNSSLFPHFLKSRKTILN